MLAMRALLCSPSSLSARQGQFWYCMRGKKVVLEEGGVNWKGGVGGGEGEGGEVALIHCNTDQIQRSNLSLKATDLQITSMTAAPLCTKLENIQNSWSSAVRMQPAALGYRAGAAPQLQPQLWPGRTHPRRAGGHPRARGSACMVGAQDSPGGTRGGQRAGWR